MICGVLEFTVLKFSFKNKFLISFKVRKLSVFGGMDVRETVYRLMKEVMSNMLGREYNMNGLKGKKKRMPPDTKRLVQ